MTRDKPSRPTQPLALADQLSTPATPLSPTPVHAQLPSASTCPPWRRILYEQQPYADNYTPGDWLSAMSSYSSSPDESEYLPYGAVVWLTLVIASRASILSMFVTAFHAINQHAVSSRSLAVLNMSVAGVLVAVQYYCHRRSHHGSASPASSSSTSDLSLASVCLLCFLLLLVSPLLSTLTWSYSSDTIYLLAFLLSVAHLLSFDYSSINNPIAPAQAAPANPTTTTTTTAPTTATSSVRTEQLEAAELSGVVSTVLPSASSLAPLHHPVSLNCALLLSLLLASRLSSPLHVSLLLLLSSLLFAVSPSQQQLLCRCSATAHLASFVALSLLCCYVLCVYGTVLLAVAYVVCVVSACFVCPWWLLRVQRYKRTIHGPWDYNDEPETSSENL